MLMFKKIAFAVLLAAVTVSIAGCATYGESAGLGAVLGAGAGAIIGNQSGHAGEGALIGAAFGTVAGLVAHDSQVRRVESPQRYASHPPHSPSSPAQSLVLEEATVNPSKVRRGSTVEASIQYELLGSRYGTRVTETRVLKRGDEVIERFFSKSSTRGDGSWISSQKFEVSDNLEPGEYTIEQTIRAKDMVISSSSRLEVN